MKNYFEKRLLNLSAIAGIVFFWQGLSYLNILNDNLLPSPFRVFIAIFDGVLSGEILIDSLQSIKRVLIGYFLGGVVGISVGLLASVNEKLGQIINSPIEFIRPIPPIAWIPIAILWFGSGEPSAYFLVSLGSFFPILTNTFLGISQVSIGTIEVAKCYGASRFTIFKKVVFPQALPSIFSGLQTGLGISWMIVITAELVGVQSGLGYFIQVSRAQLKIEEVVAGMVLIGLIGFTLSQALKYLSKKIMPWKSRLRRLGYNE
jgi:ABC-type nitrate/sulfonate/bicarbonate transport system permease component